ncbi:MAG TPA: transcription elongation factor GreA [Candidatus Limnocylindrales bacterium]|nr:transcription elongation factor GreA [Candidatus Limnocylindrales bacterium]
MQKLKIVERLQNELAVLRRELNIELPKIIEEARAHGDLKENAEYHAAKEKQGMVSARVGNLEARIKELSMYTISSISRDAIGYGSLVELEDLETGETITYEMVFPEEVDMAAGKISLTSPVGQALLKRTVGDEVKIQLPNARKSYEILAVKTIHDRGLTE